VEHLNGNGAPPAASGAGRRVSTPALVVWWVVTVVTLVVLDDLVFGPVFWALGRWTGPLVAAATAFAVYFVAQVAMVHQGTQERPGRLARFFLRRLGLGRTDRRGRLHEDEIRERVLGGVSAVLLAPILGGVVPPMLLWHRGFDRGFVRRLTVVTSAVYSAEFAVLHGWIPATIAR
jgi:hypothetical protein